MGYLTYFQALSLIVISFLLAVIAYLLATLVKCQKKYINPDKDLEKKLLFTNGENCVLTLGEFHHEIEKIIKIGEISKYVYIVIDIDDFKMINKLYGEFMGDKLLDYIRSVIKKNLKDKDSYTRVEADIFAIFMRKDCTCNWYKRVENITNSIMGYHEGGMEVIPSVGIYEIEDNNKDLVTINTNAYLAKRMVKGYKDKLIYKYGNNETEQFIDKKMLIRDFKRGIDTKEYKIYFQVQKDIQSKEVTGAEILVRWFHKDRGMVLPNNFISIFEETGDIIELDLYVFEETCKKLSEWCHSGLDISSKVFSVNLSRNTFIQPQIPLKIAEITDRYLIKPEMLELELTESSFLGDSLVISKQVKVFKSLGFSVAIDDFGSGYSSLNVLKDMEVNTLKLDRVFLEEEVNKEDKGTKIIDGIIKLSKELGLKVIVEGVETESQQDYLATTGCDIGQGYHYSRPLCSEDFRLQFLKSFNDNDN